MKDTVMTAADPAIPTCWRRPGAAAADVAMIGDCCLFRLMIIIYNYTAIDGWRWKVDRELWDSIV
jgi:hypothetical protein